MMTRIGGACVFMVRICTGRGVGAQHLALALVVGREEEGVVHLPRRMAERES